MYFDTSLKTSRKDCSGISSPGTHDDTTMLVQIEEMKRAIRALPFVKNCHRYVHITAMVLGGGFP
jgi:hypothetical protein